MAKGRARIDDWLQAPFERGSPEDEAWRDRWQAMLAEIALDHIAANGVLTPMHFRMEVEGRVRALAPDDPRRLGYRHMMDALDDAVRRVGRFRR